MLIVTFTLVGNSKFTVEFENYEDLYQFAHNNKDTIIYISANRKLKGDTDDNKSLQR